MNTTINTVELAGKLAVEKLHSYADNLNESDYNFEFPNGLEIETDDEVSYTDEAQEVVNEFYDYYLNLILSTQV